MKKKEQVLYISENREDKGVLCSLPSRPLAPKTGPGIALIHLLRFP